MKLRANRASHCLFYTVFANRGRPSLVYFLFPVPIFCKTRGGREVIVDYLLCQYAKVKCGTIAYLNAFYSLYIAVKITPRQKIIVSGH